MDELINILDAKKGENPGIHFGQAIGKNCTNDFVRSGSKRILDYLIQQLGDIPMLIDFSSRPSSFKNDGNLADFVTIYDPGKGFFVQMLDDAFFNVYDTLGVNGYNLGLFYKSDFFHNPLSPLYYYSNAVRIEFKEKIATEWLPNSNKKAEFDKAPKAEWIVPKENRNVRFKNESIQLSYSEYEKNIQKTAGSYNCTERNEILLGFYDKYFKNPNFKTNGHLLSIPLIGFPSRTGPPENVFEGLGAIFVYFFAEPKPDAAKIRKIANELWFLGLQITYNSMFQIAYELAETAKKESLKSAIAAIMSRNMSHNLGSHPLTNTKNYFRKRIDEVVSKDRYNCEDVGADYRGNVHLLQYIKERMDFIATVVSSDLYPFGALNFKAQLFDVLTEDYHGARHDKETQNFLLKYLVFSEKLTRYDCNNPKDYKNLDLRILYKIKSEEGKYTEYTGKTSKMKDEESQKLFLSKLELAVPGGLMGRHAFFCIIENIIRNSAKHSKKNENLLITIKLELNDDERTMNISIFDNRKSGKNVMDVIIDKHLKQLVILKEENNRIDKNSKGIKEMLICALWLRNENVAEKLYEIQNEKDGEKKIDLIKKYMDVSLVDKDGEKKENEGNLCYTIKNIPRFETCYQLKDGEDYKTIVKKDIVGIHLSEDKLVNLHADIVAADKDHLFYIQKDGKDDVKGIVERRHLSDIFPRFVDLSKFNKDEKEKWDMAYQSKNDKELFKMFDETNGAKLLKEHSVISIDSSKFNGEINDGYGIRVEGCKIDESDWTILFKEHFDSKTGKEDKEKYVKKYKGKYLESSSGENFTSTIATFDFLRAPVNRYKVVEAANTRIAIIDERIYGDFQTRWNGDVGVEQELLEMRGIYLLNYDNQNGKIIDLQGNEFVKNENINFVSIHLGLLDKKNQEGKGQKNSANIKENILDKYFDEKTFVSIHSGRGNFSADLESELKNYPFISLSALEAAFYDCKYFLTQLFKTTNYYGKGNITDK